MEYGFPGPPTLRPCPLSREYRPGGTRRSPTTSSCAITQAGSPRAQAHRADWVVRWPLSPSRKPRGSRTSASGITTGHWILAGRPTDSRGGSIPAAPRPARSSDSNPRRTKLSGAVQVACENSPESGGAPARDVGFCGSGCIHRKVHHPRRPTKRPSPARPPIGREARSESVKRPPGARHRWKVTGERLAAGLRPERTVRCDRCQDDGLRPSQRVPRQSRPDGIQC